MKISPRQVRRFGLASTRWSAPLRSGLTALGIACALLLFGVHRPTAAAAPAKHDGVKIHLGSHSFDPLTETPSLPQGLKREAGRRDEVSYYIVQFADRITPEMRKELDKTGAAALHYVHENAFIVRADAAAIDRAAALPSVRWVGPYEPAYAFSPTLALEYDDVLNKEMKEAGKSGPKIDTSKRIAVSILTMESSRVEEVAREAEGHGASGVIRSEKSSGLVRAVVPRAALESLARRDGVLWIEREWPAEALNDIARWTIQSFDSQTLTAPVHQHGVTGLGQTVTISDTGADTSHTALSGKFTAYYTPPNASGDSSDNGVTQHGTHVSGSVAGDGATSGQYDGDGVNSGNTALEKVEPHDGQAFRAMLNMQDLSTDGSSIHPSSDLTTHYDAAVSHGSWINTNSWNSNAGLGTYGAPASQTDDYIWTHPTFTVLFAANNKGPGLNTIGPFATAKNMITVGASGNGGAAGSPAGFSSRGPTVDGRLKPDLMAPGVGLWSARGCNAGSGCVSGDFNTYKALSGTSMATPTVAGAAALVRQYYMGGWYPTGDPATGTPMTPSAALIKATLINSTVEMTSDLAYANGEQRYPNDNQGWGRILLDNALYFAGDTRDLVVADDPGVTTAQTKTFQFVVADPFEPFKVTLVWSDRARTAPTTPDLINDLDLVVTAPNGTIYRGNAFQGFNPGQSKPNALISEADHLNNVENVLVISPTSLGVWTVQVTGNNVPQGDAQGRQPFALVMTGRQNRNFGVVAIDKDEYISSETVNVAVLDANLNQNPNVAETTTVQMTSSTETTPEILTLNETSANSGVFTGSIPLLSSSTPVHGNNHLEVVNGNTITASYFDANDGAGGSGTRTATATVDETPPVISSVTVSNVQPRQATISWATDEPADSTVNYGASFPLSGTVSDSLLSTGHQLLLQSLTPGVTYLFQVSSADEHGNLATNNNGGAYFSFMTPTISIQPAPEWPTYQNSGNRQGTSGSFIQPPLTALWNVANNTNMVGGSAPVVSDGLVFTAEDGYVRARDAATGALFWERQLGDAFQFSSTPVVSNGIVYAGIVTTIEDPYYGILQKGFLYALSEYDGSTVWTYTRGVQGIDTRFMLTLEGGVIVTKDTADIAAVAGVNIATGVEAWGYAFPGLTPTAGAASGNGKIFFPAIGPGGTGYVTALDAATGALAWSSLGLHFLSRVPLFAQDTVYVGESLGNSGQTATMYALNAGTGALRWTASDYNQFLSSPTYDGTTLYIGTSDSLGNVGFAAIDSTSGDPVWFNSVSTGMSSASSSLVYVNGYIFAVSDDGKIRTLNASTGAIVGTITIGEGTNSAHLAVAGNSIFVEGVYGTLFAFAAQEDPDDDNDGDPDVSDCAPLDPSRHHGATELCNGIDDDCVSGIDNGFPNSDGDSQADCIDPDDDNDGVPDGSDCAPTNPYNFPGNTEVCDNQDNDCDSIVDEGFDVDGDGYKTCTNDCNDANPNIHPGATEACNLVDDDCDGLVDEGFDADGDGWTTCAGDCHDDDARINGYEASDANGSCFDQLDNDCDGVVDWDCALDVVPPENIVLGSIPPTGGLSSLASGSTPDDTYYAISENSSKRLEVYYKFNLPPYTAGWGSVWWALRVEGYRTGNDTHNFQVAKITSSQSCGTSTTGFQQAFTFSKSSDDDRLQAYQIGPPNSDTVSFCVKLIDQNQSPDNQADTVRLDKMYIFPITLDAKATGELTIEEGTHESGNYINTQSVGSGQEVLREGAATTHLKNTWVFDNVPVGFSHTLYFEATRPNNSEGDNFQFYYALPLANGNPGTFSQISGALVSTPTAPGAVTSSAFGPAGMVGKVFIQIRDTKQNGSILDSVSIDYLAIRTTP